MATYALLIALAFAAFLIVMGMRRGAMSSRALGWTIILVALGFAVGGGVFAWMGKYHFAAPLVIFSLVLLGLRPWLSADKKD